MDLKSLVCVFFLFLAIHISFSNPESTLSSTSSPSKQVQESLAHGVVGTTAYARVQDVAVDHEGGLSFVKRAHGSGGGGAAIHHSGRNGASSLSTHSLFAFPCVIAIFGLTLLPIF